MLLYTRTYICVYICFSFCDIYNAVPVCAFAVRVLIVPCAMCFAYCGVGNKMEGAEPAHQRYLFSESDTFFAAHPEEPICGIQFWHVISTSSLACTVVAARSLTS